MGLAATAVTVTERSIMNEMKSLDDHVRHLEWHVKSTNDELEMLSHIGKRYEHVDYNTLNNTFRVLRFHKDDKVEVTIINDVVFRCVNVFWKGNHAKLLEYNNVGTELKSWMRRMCADSAEACVAATKGS